MNKIPKTPAEVLRFVDNGMCELLRDMHYKIGTVQQINARMADAMTDYESILKTIAKHSSCKESKSDARYVLNKHKIKS